MPKMIDPFEIPNELKPYWMTYQWVRSSVMGIPDQDNVKRSKLAGWRSINKRRHGTLKASGLWDDKSPWIEYCGLILMERPTYMSVAARTAELDEAKSQYNGWCEQVGRATERSFIPRCFRPAAAKRLWASIKCLPRIEPHRVMPRLTYPFKKQ